MPVTPVGEISTALAEVPRLLCDCADFRTIMGAANAAAALAKGATQSLPSHRAAPCWTAIIGEPSTDSEIATGTDRVEWQVNVVIEWPIESVGGDTEQDKTLRALNRIDALRTQVRTLMNTGTYLRRISRQWIYPIRTGADDPERGDRWVAEVIFSPE